MNQHLCRLKPARSLQQRLAERVRRHVEAKLALQAEREDLAQKTKQSDATAHKDEFRGSLGLKPPE
jgi:hypothetical protein